MLPDLGMGWEMIGGRISLWPVLVRVTTVTVVLVTSQLAQSSRREHLDKTSDHYLHAWWILTGRGGRRKGGGKEGRE